MDDIIYVDIKDIVLEDELSLQHQIIVTKDGVPYNITIQQIKSFFNITDENQKLLIGNGAPDNDLTGKDGNYYLDKANLLLYGPKAANNWGEGVSFGGNSTPETATSIGSLINNSSSKGTPVDGDMFAVRDSVSGLLQKIPFLSLKGSLKTYFDQFYAYAFKTINGQSIIGNGDITISGGGTSTPETATSIGALINNSTEKSAPVDADMFAIRDSVSGLLQKLSFSNLKKILKDYFDTHYNNYTHPANHAPSVISQDANNRFVTDSEKLNIPKNTALIQDFSQSNITIDFTDYDIQEHIGFDTNEAISTGNKSITITKPFLNKVVTVLLPKLTEGTVIILPDGCKKLTGDYSDTLQNIIMIHCTKTLPARYLYTISQIQA